MDLVLLVHVGILRQKSGEVCFPLLTMRKDRATLEYFHGAFVVLHRVRVALDARAVRDLDFLALLAFRFENRVQILRVTDEGLGIHWCSAQPSGARLEGLTSGAL